MTLHDSFPHCSARELARGVSMSLLSTRRLASIGKCLARVRKVEGDTVEVGVAAGGTSRLIVAGSNRRHWACDTFDGLCDVGEHDRGLTNKMFKNVFPPVAKELAEYRERVQFVAGYFPTSAPEAMRVARYAFVHIDVDTYESINNCFRFFESRMSPGAIIALDDVLDGGCSGAQKAWREIVAQGSDRWAIYRREDPQVVVKFKELRT